MKYLVVEDTTEYYKHINTVLAGEEIVLASENNGESFAMRKKNESEKQADSAR